MSVNAATAISRAPCPAQILRCPITHGELRSLAAEQLVAINERIARSELQHLDGSTVQGELQACYQTVDGEFAYGVRDGIVLLLPALAVALRGRPERRDATVALREEKQAVQNFYNEYGWVQDNGGLFTDTALYEDLRGVAADYIRDCHMRVKRHLPSRGRYLLDVASGPVQYPEYVTYSEDYDARICVDLSYAALQAARRKLGNRGIYVLGDITNLPLRDGAVDAAISLHTIYHVPADEQAEAFREVARVLQAGGRAAVVYVWKTRWVRAAMLPARLFRLPWRLAGKLWRAATSAQKPDKPRRLHFHAHPYRWFVGQDWPFEYEIHSWRSVTAPLTKCYFHPWLLGRAAFRWLYKLEDAMPHTLGRFGAYPLILIDKPAADAAAGEVARAA